MKCLILEFLKIPLKNVFFIEPTKRSKISVSFHKLYGDKENINLFQISSDPHILNELIECGFVDFIKSEYFNVFNKFCEIKEKVKQLETADKLWIDNI